MKDKVLLFIPTYRCQKQIVRVLEKIDPSIQELIDTILVLDNRSPDQTFEVAEAIGKERIRHCKFISRKNDKNVGLGGSHKIAFSYAIENHFDHIIVLHGDDQADIQDLMPFLRRRDADVDCFLGSRFMKSSRLQGYSLFRNAGNRFFNFLFSVASGRQIKDLGSGLNFYKVSALKSLPFLHLPDDLTFNYSLLLASCRAGQKINFFPISWREEDQRSNVKMIQQSFKLLALLFRYIGAKEVVAPHKNTTTLVITMAGKGSRFANVGIHIPKYEIEVHGKSLFAWSLRSLQNFINTKTPVIFVCLKENKSRPFVENQCRHLKIRNFSILELDQITDGQATSAYLTRHLWHKNDGLLIYNIDTAVSPHALNPADIPDAADGWIPCFDVPGEQWSFVQVDSDGWALKVTEKQRVSNHASIGLYWFRKVGDFVEAYERHFSNPANLVRGERYIAPLYNDLIRNGKKIAISELKVSDVTALGTPADVEFFRTQPP